MEGAEDDPVVEGEILQPMDNMQQLKSMHSSPSIWVLNDDEAEANLMHGKSELRVIFLGPKGHGKSTIFGKMLAQNVTIPTSVQHDIQKAFRELNEDNVEPSWYVDNEESERLERTTKSVFTYDMMWGNVYLNVIQVPLSRENMPKISCFFGQVDAAILVISAEEFSLDCLRNEMVSEQLSLLSAHDVKYVVVAITKIDLLANQVIPDRMEQRIKDIEKIIKTHLEKYQFHLEFSVICGKYDDLTFDTSPDKVPTISRRGLLKCLEDTSELLHSTPYLYMLYDLTERYNTLFHIYRYVVVDNVPNLYKNCTVELEGMLENGKLFEGVEYLSEPDWAIVHVLKIKTKGFQAQGVESGTRAKVLAQIYHTDIHMIRAGSVLVHKDWGWYHRSKALIASQITEVWSESGQGPTEGPVTLPDMKIDVQFRLLDEGCVFPNCYKPDTRMGSFSLWDISTDKLVGHGRVQSLLP